MISGNDKDYISFEEFKKLQEIDHWYENKKKQEVEVRPFFRPIKDWCQHFAVFFDDNGIYLGKKRIKWTNYHFSWRGKTFNFLPADATFFKDSRFFSTRKFYPYNINDPNPLLLNKKCQPVIRSDVYKTILDSDLVTKLNPKKLNIIEMLGGWKVIIAILIIGAVIYYFASGGTIT